jgi:hypothetical protein
MTPKIPSNLITTKYTSGGKLMYIDTYKEYQGYYYEYGNKKFVGKEFNINAPELIEINSDKINPLLNSPSTFVYGISSNIDFKNIFSSKFLTLPSSLQKNTSDELYYRYFVKKINSSIIKEVDEKTYITLRKNPLYQTTVVNSKLTNLEKAERELPGIKDFIYSN